jgi:hypothetical protein
LTLPRAQELFGSIVGVRYRDPGTPSCHFRDRGDFICTKLDIAQNKPVVFRRLASASAHNSEELSPIDLRDVVNYLDPDFSVTSHTQGRFSLKKLVAQFNKIIFLISNSPPSSQITPISNGLSYNQQSDSSSISGTQGEALNDLLMARPTAPARRNIQEELAIQGPNGEAPLNEVVAVPVIIPVEQPEPQDRLLRPPEYNENTCILDIDILHLGILIDLFPTSKSIAKHLRSEFKHLLTEALHKVIGDPDNERAQKEYLLLPLAIMSKKSSKAFNSKQAITHLMEKNWAPFTLAAFAKRQLPDMDEDVRKKVKTKVAEGYLRMGGIAKAYATSTRAILPDTHSPQEILNFFVTIHPPRDYDIPPMDDLTKNKALQVTSTDVLQAIRKSKPLKAPGILCLRYDHLRYICAGEEFEQPSAFLSAFTDLINKIATARAPKTLACFLFETKGIGLPKPGGKLRPIGMRDTHVNLALTIIIKKEKENIIETFKDCNFAQNGAKGIDKAISHTQRYRELNPKQDTVFLDGTSAFQLVRRDVSLLTSKEYLPGIAPLLHSLHENKSRVWVTSGDDAPVGISTEEGTTQGCGGGTIQYACGAKTLYDGLQQKANEADNPAYFIAYSDDGNIGAETETACALLKQYQTNGPLCGVVPNTDKGLILLGEKDNAVEIDSAISQYVALGISRTQILVHPTNGGDPLLYGGRYLGVPIGSDEYVTQYMVTHLEKYKEEVKLLIEVENPQHKWIFLYYCFARKPSFILRHILPSLTRDFCSKFDDLIKEVFESIVNIKLTAVQWKQVKIPVKNGGCGLPATSDVASAAFVANAFETKEYLLRKVPEVMGLVDPDEEEGHPDERYASELVKLLLLLLLLLLLCYY